MDDPLKEELFPEVKEATPVVSQRFLYQCKLCSSIKFEILMIQENGVKSMSLFCMKGHESVIKNIPQLVDGGQS